MMRPITFALICLLFAFFCPIYMASGATTSGYVVKDNDTSKRIKKRMTIRKGSF